MCPRNEIVELTSKAGDRIRCRLADSFLSRLKGLMGQPRPDDGIGLLIRPCNSIHMFFMKFSIDAVFLDRDFKIVKLFKNLEPGNLVNPVRGAHQVLEVPSGELPESFAEGDNLKINAT